MSKHKLLLLVLVFFGMAGLSHAQSPASSSFSGLTVSHDYVQKRISSYDRSGANADSLQIAPGETLTLFDEPGPGTITHIWITIATDEQFHLKKLVLRMYWDGEASPSVEAPVGDFFGLGNGEYFRYESAVLAVASDKALNSFFPMPFQKHGRITVTNEGTEKVGAFYFNIDYQAHAKPLPQDALYFHAQYRQAYPAVGLDEPMAFQWRPARGRKEKSHRRRELRLVGSEGKGPLCRRDHVHPAKSG